MENNLTILKENFKELPNNIEAEQAVIGSILVTNEIFDDERKANDFGKKSMKRGFEHKVLEFTKDNMDKYWYAKKR